MPDFDGPEALLAALAEASVTGEFRDHSGWVTPRGASGGSAGG